MPFSFPASPSVNQQSTQNGRTYSWSGSAWELVAASGGGGSDSRWDLFLPPAPTSVIANGGDAAATVSWTAPTVLAQTPITDYAVQFSSNSGSTWTTFSDGTSTATSATVTGLTNGTAYTFRVAAVNGVGTGAYSTASAAVTPGSDPYFANVSLLLHMDGTGSAFVDSSPSPKAINASYGSPTQSTTKSKFGGKSLYLNGSSSIAAQASSAFDFGAGDFTIEFWVLFDSVASGQRVAGGDQQSGGSYNWALFTTVSGRLDYYMSTGTPWDIANGQQFGSVATDQWYHVALVRNGTTITGYLNGVAGSSVTSSSALASNSTNGPHFGFATGGYFNGYVDDVRITKGVARYSTTFTPPTAAFPDS